jgi:hypothetical protein
MINMSQPIHKKYNVAITKQLGRYMEAIVVDTESTARQCIQYLKVRSTRVCNRNLLCLLKVSIRTIPKQVSRCLEGSGVLPFKGIVSRGEYFFEGL